jgi:hypothetical protein
VISNLHSSFFDPHPHILIIPFLMDIWIADPAERAQAIEKLRIAIESEQAEIVQLSRRLTRQESEDTNSTNVQDEVVRERETRRALERKQLERMQEKLVRKESLMWSLIADHAVVHKK